MGRDGLPRFLLGALLTCGTGCGATLDDSGASEIAAAAPPTLHRLTQAQYRETVRSLLGDDIRVPKDLETDTPLHGFTTVGASELTISPRAAELYEAAALDLAHQVFSDEGRRSKLLGAKCHPTAPSDPCVREFLAGFGRRAWRRPLTDDELALLGQLVADLAIPLGGVTAGLEYTVAGMLESPHFLFRVELGEPDPRRPAGTTRLRYTSYEMASRLSYLLWNSGPDDELLDAAERGELVDTEQLRAQAVRLLAAPRAQAAVLGFFAEYFSLGRLDTAAKDKKLFPQFTPALIAAMREEILRDVGDVIFTRDADYRELLGGTTTFINDELARLYGLPSPGAGGDFAPVELPASTQRGGLLGTAGILALNAHATTTSPTHRGKFVREYLLCQDIPPPPPGVVTSLDPEMGAGPLTLRQRLSRHRADPACGGCHALMDPIGLGLENFDPIGVFRDREAGQPIDASAELDGASFSGARQLGQVLGRHPQLADCAARQLYRHATGHVEEPGEQRSIRLLGEAFAERGYHFRDLILRLIVSDGFRLADSPSAEQGG